MIIKKKEVPANSSIAWTKGDRKILKDMVKRGKSLKEIGEALGRSVGSVGYQKSVMGLVQKRVKTKGGKSVSVKEVKIPTGGESVTPRDNAKEMARVARGIARENGKRITMAMFFVEDL